MKKKIAILILIAAVLIGGCSPLLTGGGKQGTDLKEAVAGYLHNMYLVGSSWSLMAVDLESGRILLKQDEERSLIPASNMKLMTTACALETLGPKYRFETRIGYRGTIDETGILHGDLIILGEGDPTIATRYKWVHGLNTDTDSTEVFADWARSIRQAGILGIDGDILGYSVGRGGDKYGSGWEWNDLKHWYAAEISPLIYADDCIEVTVTHGLDAGADATIEWVPAFGKLSFHGKVITTGPEVEPSIHFDRRMGSNIVTIWGTIPLGAEPQKLWVSVNDAQTHFLEALRELLIENGISVSGSALASYSEWNNGADYSPVYTHYSPPLSQIIRIINQDSHNLYAETVMRALGRETLASGRTTVTRNDDAFEAGREAVKTWEDGLVGASPGFVMADGSGMSRRNLLSASEIIKVLVHMNRSQYQREFLQSLAIPGVGTMKYRLHGLPTSLTIHVKTGKMGRVRALSGYIGVAGGQKIAFAMICNNYLCAASEVEATMDNICQRLALYLMKD